MVELELPKILVHRLPQNTSSCLDINLYINLDIHLDIDLDINVPKNQNNFIL